MEKNERRLAFNRLSLFKVGQAKAIEIKVTAFGHFGRFFSVEVRGLGPMTRAVCLHD
jgi:hypothetical protein